MSIKSYFQNRKKPVSQEEVKAEIIVNPPAELPVPVAVNPECLCYGCWMNCSYGPAGLWFY